MSIKIIHVGSSHHMGLTNQETQLGLAYKEITGIECLVVTGEKEQYKGCFKQLSDSNINNKIISGFDEHIEFMRLVKDFLIISKEFRPDIVTVNTNWQLAIVGTARLLTSEKFKIVYTIHGFRHNDKFKSYIARFAIGSLLFFFADAINAPTNYVKNKFSFLKNKIYTIPLGEDQIFFDNSQKHDFVKPLNFIFPGVFRHGKNQEMLINAFYKYINVTEDKECMLFLPGEGEQRGQAKQLAFDLGIINQVIFPGQLSRVDILDMYKKCQIALIPSNDETFGHCIAEPMVMQCIVVSRKIGLAPDFISDGVNGFLFEDQDQLVEVLLKIKSINKDQLQKIALAAKETGQNFSWPDIAMRHFNEIFKPLCKLS